MGFPSRSRSTFSYEAYMKKADIISAVRTQFSQKSINEWQPLTDFMSELTRDKYKSNRRGKIYRRKQRSKARNTVDYILGKRQNTDGIYQRYKRKENQRKFLELAIGEGIIRNIRLPVPWHPEIYSEPDKLTTVPWQHETAVLYSGRKILDFYSREQTLESLPRSPKNNIESEKDLYNLESILKTGYIEPGNSNVANPKEAEKELRSQSGLSHHAAPWAIFLTANIEVAKSYSGVKAEYSPVLELETPTKFLWMPTSRRKSHSGQKIFVKNRRQFFQKYESPKKLAEVTVREDEFAYTRKENSGYPVIPLDYVNGVWDTTKNNNPHFEPLEDYIDYLYQTIPERLPEPSNIRLSVGAKARETFKRKKSVPEKNLAEAESIKYLKRLVGECASKSKVIYAKVYRLQNNSTLREDDIISSREKDLNNLLYALHGYEEYRKTIFDLMKDRFQYDEKPPTVSLSELSNLPALRNWRRKVKKKSELYQEKYEKVEKHLLKQEKIGDKNNGFYIKAILKYPHQFPYFRINQESMEKFLEGLATDQKELEKFREIAKNNF